MERRRQEYQTARDRANQALGVGGALPSQLLQQATTTSVLMGMAGPDADLAEMLGSPQRQQGAQRLTTISPSYAKESSLSQRDRKVLERAGDVLTKKGLLTSAELRTMGERSEKNPAERKRNEQDASVLEAATFVMGRKHRGASILVPGTSGGGGRGRGDANALRGASDVMRRKGRGMSIVGEIAQERQNEDDYKYADVEEGETRLFSSSSSSSSSPRRPILSLSSNVSADGTYERPTSYRKRTGGVTSWLLSPRRHRLPAPPPGMRSASVVLRGDQMLELLHTDRSGKLPPPPSGVRSASIVELSRVNNSGRRDGGSPRFYGGASGRVMQPAFSQSSDHHSYTTRSISPPRSTELSSSSRNRSPPPPPPPPSPPSSSSPSTSLRQYSSHSGPMSILSMATRLPPPPPGVRSASMMMSPAQANRLQADLESSNNSNSSNSKKNQVSEKEVADAELEQWIKKNIPEHVLMGDESVNDGRTKIVEDPMMTRRVDMLASPARPVVGKHVSDSSPAWVPVGINSNLTSFHREQLADARTALRTLKMKKDELTYKNQIFRGEFYFIFFKSHLSHIISLTSSLSYHLSHISHTLDFFMFLFFSPLSSSS